MSGLGDHEMTKGFLHAGARSKRRVRLPGAVARIRVLGPVLLALPAAALALASCEGCRSSPFSDAKSPPVLADATPAVRLYLLTDVAGALEPCGCTKDQLGGLDHFGAWVKASATPAISAFVASAGPLFFMDPALAPDHASQDRAKAETIARVLHEVGFAAFAPGTNDWAEGPEALANLANASGAAVLAGSGLASPARPSPPFATTAVRRVARVGAGLLAVGFVGYGQGQGKDSGASVEDAIRRGVAEAKAQGANVLVALAAVGRGEGKRIADAIPELTAVVVGSSRSAGDGNTSAPPAERVGDVLVVQAADHLQSVAVLNLYVREAVSPGQVVKFADATGLERAQRREELSRRIDELRVRMASWQQDRSVSPSDIAARRRNLAALETERDALDAKPPPLRGSFFRYGVKEIRESLGKDPTIDAEFLAYYKAVDEHNRVAFADRLPPPHGPLDATYVGVEACTGCHPGPRAVWNSTRHAGAYATLASQFKEYNLDCVGCHVTGYERPGGSTVTHVDALRNVQCEVCHGPGSRHVLDPSDKAAITAVPAPSLCIECHQPPHVEGFDPVAKMAEILGPGHGLPAK